MEEIAKLEKQLESFDAAERAAALDALAAKLEAGEVKCKLENGWVNQHMHTFYSYNAYGYSPSTLAWLSKKEGISLAGSVDFDVLDAVEEFTAACKKLGVKGCCGMETRTFVPEFSTREINSPGEPGVSYHLGLGFVSEKAPAGYEDFLNGMRETARERNLELLAKVNDFMPEVAVDYETDVLKLTPKGVATERHICEAYARKAIEKYGEGEKLAEFWEAKLGVPAADLDLPFSAKIQNAIRAKTMKRGGVGYVQPGPDSFPPMAAFNEFILAAGAVPTVCWLNGKTDGEKEMEELLDVAMSSGVAMVNIIPDRNYTVGIKDELLENLYAFVKMSQERNLPIIAGTEMNSPGNKFVDTFDAEELAPLLPVFMEGGYILYAHSVLQRQAGMGYLSGWAKKTFGEDIAAKNAFFAELGKKVDPKNPEAYAALNAESSKEDALNI